MSLDKIKKYKTKTTLKDLYYCPMCKISTLTSHRMCPCPRGSCEAYFAGEITTVTTRSINIFKTEE